LGSTSFEKLGGASAAAAASNSLLLYAAVRFLVALTPDYIALLVAVLAESFALTSVDTFDSTFVLSSSIFLLYVVELPKALVTIDTIPSFPCSYSVATSLTASSAYLYAFLIFFSSFSNFSA